MKLLVLKRLILFLGLLISVSISAENIVPDHNTQLKYSVFNTEGESVNDNDGLGFEFSITNQKKTEDRYLLDLGNRQIKNVRLFRYKNGELFLVANQLLAKPILLNIPKGETVHYYLEVDNDGKGKALNDAVIYSEDAFLSFNQTNSFLNGLFYGALFLIALVALTLFFFVRERHLIYYSAYVTFFSLLQITLDGLLRDYGVLNTLYSNNLIVTVSTFSAYGFNFLFLSRFLKLKELSPKWHVFTKAVAGVMFLLVALSLIPVLLPSIGGLINMVASCCLLSLITLSIYAFVKAYPNSKLVLISYSWIVFFGVVFLLMHQAVIPDFGKVYMLKVGLLGELLILTLAMSISIYKSQLSLRFRISEELNKSKEINTQLVEAKKEVETMSQVKDRFMVNISHELRTPMNAVMGFVSILESMELPSMVKEPLKNLRYSATGLLSAVEDVLDFKQLTNTNLSTENRSFNLKHIIDSVVLPHKFEASKKKLKFTVVTDSVCDSFFIGDQKKIAKMINILLHNAFKFTKVGEVKCLVSRVSKTQGDSVFRVEVVDTGIGISPDNHKRIFDSFSQLNQEQFRGTGMGLALFQRLCNLLGGKFFVQSNVGDGSTFGFELKIKNSPVNSSNRENVKSAKKLFDNLTENFEVLIVEDDAINTLIITKVLGSISSKIKINLAENGEEAIAKLVSEKVDLVFMDLQMPTIDGYEATRIIRNDLNLSRYDVPIVALTAHAMDSEREKCFEYGMNDFIPKPFTKEQLESTLVKYLKIEGEDHYDLQLESLY